MNKLKLCLALFAAVLVTGCMFEGCTPAEKIEAFKSMTSSIEGGIIQADGIHYDNGTVCRYSEACAKDLIAVPEKHVRTGKMVEVHFGGELSRSGEREMRRLGFTDTDIEEVKLKTPEHANHVSRLYWCAVRNAQLFCDLYGIRARGAFVEDAGDGISGEQMLRDYSKYVLKK